MKQLDLFQVVIDQARFADLLFIASNLREEDKRELSVTRDVEDSQGLASAAYASFYRRVAIWDRQARFAFGAGWTGNPGVVQVWGFGTPNAQVVLKPVTKFIKHVMIPELLSLGVLEARAISHPEHEAAHRWLKFLGYSPKATVTGIGSRKEDMVLFAVSANDFQRTLSAPLAA
jgi:hypothetical protein